MIGAIVGKSHMWGLGSTIAMLVFFAFLIVLAITHHNPVTYPSDDQSLAKYHEDQCERPADKGWMVEVENTLSNVGYMFAGVFVLFRAGSWAGHLLALNLVLLSIMSEIYHGTLAETPQQLDVAWVYAALLAPVTFVAIPPYRDTPITHQSRNSDRRG